MKGVCCQKTKNIAKIENKIKKLHSKLKNIRLKQIINQTTSKIVKTKPLIVFMEDLKVSNMMKNKHLSKDIAEQGINLIKSNINMSVILLLLEIKIVTYSLEKSA